MKKKKLICLSGVDGIKVLKELKSKPEPVEQLAKSKKKRVLRVGPYVVRTGPYVKLSFLALSELYDKGLPVEKPLMLMKDRTLSLVTEFVPGKKYGQILPECENFGDMRILGKSMYSFHSYGYILPDPHLDNFICRKSVLSKKAVRVDVNYIEKSMTRGAWDKGEHELLVDCINSIKFGTLIWTANILKRENRFEMMDSAVSQFLNGYVHRDDSSHTISYCVKELVGEVKDLMKKAEAVGQPFMKVYYREALKNAKKGDKLVVKFYDK